MTSTPSCLASVLSSALLTLALAAPSASAQTGTYSTYGSGCSGSTGTGPGCLSANFNGTWGGNRGVQSFALASNSGAAARVICGFELYAATASANSTLNAYIYNADSTGAPKAAIATTTIAWTAVPGWHRARISPPLVIQPNTKFFVVFDNPGRLPYMSAGPDTVEHWHSGPNWRGPYSARWNYNILCCGQTGGAAPDLSATGVPSITRPFSVQLSKGLANSAAILVLGGSNSTWGAFQLPLDLTAAGAPGCMLLASYDVASGLPTDANGAATVPYAIPNNSQLIGVQFYNQWIVLDQNANALGFAFSNGGAAKIGG